MREIGRRFVPYHPASAAAPLQAQQHSRHVHPPCDPNRCDRNRGDRDRGDRDRCARVALTSAHRAAFPRRGEASCLLFNSSVKNRVLRCASKADRKSVARARAVPENIPLVRLDPARPSLVGGVKIVVPSSTDKHDFTGISLHIVTTIGGCEAACIEKISLHRASTILSDLWTRRGGVRAVVTRSRTGAAKCAAVCDESPLRSAYRSTESVFSTVRRSRINATRLHKRVRPCRL